MSGTTQSSNAICRSWESDSLRVRNRPSDSMLCTWKPMCTRRMRIFASGRGKLPGWKICRFQKHASLSSWQTWDREPRRRRRRRSRKLCTRSECALEQEGSGCGMGANHPPAAVNAMSRREHTLVLCSVPQGVGGCVGTIPHPRIRIPLPRARPFFPRFFWRLRPLQYKY